MSEVNSLLFSSFKRLIHILSTGKKVPIEYGEISLYRAEMHILEYISMNQEITAKEIASDLKVTKGAVSQIIKKLRSKNLINAITKADNIKEKKLILTELGHSTVIAHSNKEKNLIESIKGEMNELSDKEVRIFTKIVNKLSDHLL